MKWLQTARRCPGRNPLRTLLVWNLVRGAVWIALRLAYRLRCLGAEHVPPRGPVVFACNHQSHLDPCLAGVLVGDRTPTSMARASLFRFRPFGALLRLLDARPVERGQGDRAAIRLMLAELEAGRCVLIFPEGTRSHDGAVGPFKAGALMLARRTGACIVPVAIEGAYDAWPRHRPRPRCRGWIAVRAAPAITAHDLERMGTPAALEHLRTVIDSMRLELRTLLVQRSGGRFPRSTTRPAAS